LPGTICDLSANVPAGMSLARRSERLNELPRMHGFEMGAQCRKQLLPHYFDGI